MSARIIFVSRCSECPFMHWDVSELPQCEHPDNGESGFSRTLVDEKGRRHRLPPPDWCPLRQRVTFVKLEEEGDNPTPPDEVS